MIDQLHPQNMDTPLTINELLAVEYERKLQTIYDIIDANMTVGQQVSWPFFMYVNDEYSKASKKLLVVGQETYGWKNGASRPTVTQAMQFYNCVVHQTEFHNSPFWWFRRLLAERLGIESQYSLASLWTNLSKIDVDKKRPQGELYHNTMLLFMEILAQEINIVQPDIILILTANGYYNWHIEHFFAQHMNWYKQPLESGIYKLHSKILPPSTFQMPHPNSLRYQKGSFADKANRLIDIIIKHIP